MPGYTGDICDTDIDECLSGKLIHCSLEKKITWIKYLVSGPCLNSYDCDNLIADYTCYCGPGWKNY